MYSVCLDVWSSCASDQYCGQVEICPAPVSDFDFTAEGLTIFFENSSLYALTYFWDFGDGYFSNLPDPFHSYDQPGDYNVCLMTWNGCGNDTACEMIYLSGSVSVEEGWRSRITVYPNPVRDKLFIKGLDKENIRILLINIQGSIILEEDISTREYPASIDLSSIPAGIYCLRMVGDDLNLSKKIVIK